MLTVQFPFDLENSDVKHGFEVAQSPEYQSTKPASDIELVFLIRDFLQDNPSRLAYNLGFFFGLYQPTKEK